MKALELAEAYADAVSTHRLESIYGTSKSYTLEKAKERDEAHEALATELRRLAAVEAERDALKAENERLTNCLKKANDQAEDFERRWYLADMELERIKSLPPIAWEVYVADADNAYVVESLDDPQLIDDCTNSDAVVTPLIALGSKTDE